MERPHISAIVIVCISSASFHCFGQSPPPANAKHGPVAVEGVVGGNPDGTKAPATPPQPVAPSRFEDWPSPAATPASIAQIYQFDPAKADASAVGVVASRPLDFGLVYLESPAPCFSEDGQSILYLHTKASNSTDVDLIAKSLTRGVVERKMLLKQIGSITAMGWSPDRKRVMLLGGNDALAVADFEKQTRIDLPVRCPLYRLGSEISVVWKSEDKVLIMEGATCHVLDLNDLTFKDAKPSPRRRNADDEQGNENIRPAAFASARWRLSKEYVGDSKCLLIKNNDHSFTHQIFPNFEVPFALSPDSRCLITASNQIISIFYLGQRTPSQTKFSILLDNSTDLTPENRKRWVAERQNKGIFWAGVYSSKSNPLNGKPIGPDFDHLKGWVELTQWHERTVELVSRMELTPFQNGDVVSQICSGVGEVGDTTGIPFAPYGDLWRPLIFDNVPDSPPSDGKPAGTAAPSPSAPPPRARHGPISIEQAADDEIAFRTKQDERFKRAETALNEVYGKLRARLSEAQKAKLKQEQLQWLRQRTETGRRTDDQDATSVFTERRTKELQDQLARAAE